MADYIKIHPADHVAVALTLLPAGTIVTIENKEITLLADIPQGHKFSLVPIETETPIIKYGSPPLSAL